MDLITKGLLSSKANIDTPHFRGNPTSTNPKVENDSKRIATTHFVHEAIHQSACALRVYGYTVEANQTFTLPINQCIITIGRSDFNEAGTACFIDQWGGIVYLSKNNNLATIEKDNDDFIVTNLTNMEINVICIPYSIFIN